MKPILQPTVNLDSEAIRRIREDKKLTQLYVAKVVGVTTDTVSRWENNRYPSIKRENALRLAEALEVPIDDILEQTAEAMEGTEGEDAAIEDSPRRRISPRTLWLAALLSATVVAGAYYLFSRPVDVPPGQFSGERLLPNFAAPGDVIPVRLRLATGTSAKGFILRERFPLGWQLVEANPPPSSLDNEEGVARWIIKPGEERKRVVYRLRVGPEAVVANRPDFAGEIIVNPDGRSRQIPVGGEAKIEVAPILWADLNGDMVVDDGEMLEASDTVDEMKGVHMDWEALEKIWDAGGYGWDDKKKGFVPRKPSARKSARLAARVESPGWDWFRP